MRRTFAALLIITFLCSSALAWDQGAAPTFKTYICENTTELTKTTAVSTAVIDPNENRILGFSVVPLVANNPENTASLFDAVALDPYTDESFIDEAEASSSSAVASVPRWWPHPKKLNVGLTIRQSNNTRVFVYYIEGALCH